jgi:hypothetical protein
MAQVRRVRRIIRKIDAWTVFKVSAVLWFVLALALVLGLVMFWSVVDAAEIPQRITDFLVSITLLEEGSEPFADSESFLRVAVFGSVAFAVLGCGLTTLLAVMYNLIADVVGGIEFVVLEESLESQPAARPPAYLPPQPTAAGPVDVVTEEHPMVAPSRPPGAGQSG